jgi:hypothetical protein
LPGGDSKTVGDEEGHAARAAAHGDSGLALHPTTVALAAAGAILATVTTGIRMGEGSEGQAHPRQEEDCAENRAPSEPAIVPIPLHNFIYTSKLTKREAFSY